MNKDTLLTIRDLVLYVVKHSNATDDEKIELVSSLYYFLSPCEYENNVKILTKNNNNFTK